MQKVETSFRHACEEISRKLVTIDEPTNSLVKSEIKKICLKYSLDRLPRNYEILSMASTSNFRKLQNLLLKKPVKTASGVAVIALMPKPFACPHGRCTYCPGGVEFNTPNSYTGKEPVTISAIENQYDPKIQITNKLEQLISFGHDPTKLELVIVGGTFLFMPEDYQSNFIKSCYDAINGFESENLEKAKKANENSNIRNVGFTIETKPDYCKQKHVDMMLNYGVTRVEIGVQSLHERVYEIVNRGHNLNDVIDSFRIAKDAGYKIVAHMMPGLPTMKPEDDITDFKQLFEDERFKPDMLKIYPSLILKNTLLYDDYESGKHTPYSDEEMLNVLTEVKKIVPRWVRIMRIQREISPIEIVDGPKIGNLRQLVHQNLKKQGYSCKCIRCREAGLAQKKNIDLDIELERINYDSSDGKEVFLSYKDTNDFIYGFLRLRHPSKNSHRTEINKDVSIVRELHVFGKSLKIGNQGKDSFQHVGLGKKLMAEAERIAKDEFSSKKLLVISAVGTREYYQKLGYKIYGPYVSKELI